MKNILLLSLVLAVMALAFACENPMGNSGDSPTEAYKRLYAAVKSGNTDAIRAEMSLKTQNFAEFVSQQQKKPVPEVLKNGFTATTFAQTLPQMRDERIDGDNGAVEVWNSTDNRWEDLAFVREETGWKLAVGDLFAGTYKSPGKGTAIKEQEAANAMNGGGIQMNPISNANANVAANSKTNSNVK